MSCSIVLLIVILTTWISRGEEVTTTTTQVCDDNHEIESIQWHDGLNPNDIAQRRVPVIIRSSPATNWAAIKRWGNVEYLKKHLPPILENSYRSKNSSEFSYLSVDERVLIDMPLQRLLDDASDETNYYTMYSAPLLRCCKGDMLNDLIGIKSSPDIFSLDGINSEMTAWFGTDGIVTAIHCDMFQHNFFVQISGRKTFELWPPNSHFELYLHSSLLPQARESRIRDFRENDEDTFPDYIEPMIVVNLEPGDVLYIPPHHFHRVTSRRGLVDSSRLSVSLSIWAERSSKRKILDKIRSLALPFETDWSEQRLRDNAAIFLLDVVHETLQDKEHPRIFVRRLVRSRHGVTCDEDDSKIQWKQNLLKSSHHAKDIAMTLRELHNEIIEIHLADYVEEVASFVVKKNQKGLQLVSHVASYLCTV